MRWEELLSDLEAQGQSWELAERDSEVAERTRGELARVALLNRLHANLGRTVTASVTGVGVLTGVLQRVGAGWLLLGAADERLVPLPAVEYFHDLPAGAVSDSGVSIIDSRLGLTSVLRGIARDRGAVTVSLLSGGAVTGTPDRVGADFVELATHPPDVAPRPATVTGRVTVATASVAVVRRLPGGWG